MCDTIYLKKDGKSYFGKNSDRSPNEAHLMIRQEAAIHNAGEMVKATYIEIPQVSQTYACVLLKPHWIWGAEMGWNEFGLNIGNEAVFSNVKREKQDGLIGMDLLRLALERTRTAKDALMLIINLIEQYGQVGNCGFGKKFYYDNAFLIADNVEAYVLETAGRTWAYKKAGDIAAISNCYSITDDYDECSKGFTGNFKQKFQNNLFTKVAGAEKRRAAILAVLSGEGEQFMLFRQALTSHSSEKIDINSSSTSSVCMHAGNLFGDQTTGSYFGEIDKCYFVSGTSFPCLSVYKPVSKAANSLFTDEKQATKYWLNREILHRHIMSGNIDEIQYLLKAQELQDKFFKMVANAETQEELEQISAKCFEMENDFVEKNLERVKNMPIKVKGGLYFKNYWNKKTKELLNTYEK